MKYHEFIIVATSSFILPCEVSWDPDVVEIVPGSPDTKHVYNAFMNVAVE